MGLRDYVVGCRSLRGITIYGVWAERVRFITHFEEIVLSYTFQALAFQITSLFLRYSQLYYLICSFLQFSSPFQFDTVKLTDPVLKKY